MKYKVNNIQVYRFGDSVKFAISNLADKFKSALIIGRDKINTINRINELPVKKVIGTENTFIDGRPKSGPLVAGYKRPPEIVRRGGDIA